MRSSIAGHGTTCSIYFRNTCLRVFLTFRLRFRRAGCMPDMFSDQAYVKHMGGGVMQSFLKTPSKAQRNHSDNFMPFVPA